MPTANRFSFGSFVWWTGVVEDRHDPLMLGRHRVRIVGYHTKDKDELATEALYWALPIQSITSAAISGVGFSPTGIVEGTWVLGFFMDGENTQHPMILGTLAGKPSSKDPSEGFHDPNDVYPRHPVGEIDTNRLARNEKIDETIVKRKRSELEIASIAFGGTWTERSTEYNAKYPYNHTYESESGHIVEYDDTEGAERYHRWHRKGTFEEIYPDGSQVEKIVKDHYQIIMGDDFVYVKGDAKLTVDGNSHVYIKGNANIEIDGNLREHVHGNYDLKVDGTFNMKTGLTHDVQSGGTMTYTAPLILIN